MNFQNRNASTLCIFFIFFFPLLNFYGNIYCAFSAWPFRREVCVPLSLPFVWISPIFLSRSLLWRGLNTALTGSPLIWISPLPDGLQTQSSCQVVLFVLEDFSCFLLPSSRGFLQPSAILFNQISEAWAVSQDSVVRVGIRYCSGWWICMYKWLQTILLPISRTVLQLLFCFALKGLPKELLWKIR